MIADNVDQCPLTLRQIQIVKLMADGKSASEMAAIIGLSRYTINFYIADALRSAGTPKATGLVAMSLRKGWIE